LEGLVIGEAVVDIEQTDISLVKLRDGIAFENTTFETDDVDPINIRQIETNPRIGDVISMNNP